MRFLHKILFCKKVRIALRGNDGLRCEMCSYHKVSHSSFGKCFCNDVLEYDSNTHVKYHCGGSLRNLSIFGLEDFVYGHIVYGVMSRVLYRMFILPLLEK